MSRLSLVVLAIVLTGASAGLFESLQLDFKCRQALAPTSEALSVYGSALIECIQKPEIPLSFLWAFIQQPQNYMPTTDNLIRLVYQIIVNRAKSDAVSTVNEYLGVTDEIYALRKCMAGVGNFSKADGSFDTSILSASLLSQVAGTDLEANVQKGIAGCGQVTDFKVYLYLNCIQDYCAGRK
ncbi:uncharacterized protein LOC108677235 [Hyalella azteca]|uniref:Uncharacterized protein LOC108677235 n=1 Tax=Hyalella azteca TaxID=294128 RepID=A0A8B7P484_HYAAZ|nr:uncharacterized protein LOC108677235 [Hyalella azteca]